MRLKQIRILSGDSQFDVFANWQSALLAGFRRRGVPVEIVSVRDEAHTAPDEQIVSLGFNLVRNWGAPGRELRKHIAWSVDHPAFNAFFFAHRMTDPGFGRSTQLLFVDRARCAFATQKLGLEAAYFMPHASTAPDAEIDDWAGRPLDVAFFGSCGDLDGSRRALMRAAQDVSAQAVEMITGVVETFQFESAMPSDLIFRDYLARMAAGSEADMTRLFLYLFQPLDVYLRNQHRQRFFNALRSRPIHIFGSGAWDQVELHPDSVVHGPVAHREVAKIMRQSKVVINHAPTLRDGGHERVFDALASGCAVLTTPSAWLTEEFGSGSGLLECPAGGEESVAELLSTYLSADRRDEIRRGQDRARQAHTMDVRAGQLLQLIEHRWGLRTDGELVCAE